MHSRKRQRAGALAKGQQCRLSYNGCQTVIVWRQGGNGGSVTVGADSHLPAEKVYFTTPFSRYSARLVRMTLATWSAATFCISCCTIICTSCSKVVF